MSGRIVKEQEWEGEEYELETGAVMARNGSGRGWAQWN